MEKLKRSPEMVFSHDDKGSLKFLKYDVEQFYHSISRPLIEKAIKFARLHTSITVEEMILFQARKNVRMDCDGNIHKQSRL